MIDALTAMREHAKLFTEYTDYVRSRADRNRLMELAELRGFPLELLDEHKAFFVPRDGALLMAPRYREHLKSFGVLLSDNTKVFYDRFIFPIRNPEGETLNFVGYSHLSNERYIYGRAEYYERRNTLYGLENLSLVERTGVAIITEGITDTIALRKLGFKNSFAMCGTHASPIIFGAINRRAHKGVICVPDRDAAGKKAVSGWRFDRRVVVYPHHGFKDIDEMCRFSDPELVRTCISAMIEDVLDGTFPSSGEVTL